MKLTFMLVLLILIFSCGENVSHTQKDIEESNQITIPATIKNGVEQETNERSPILVSHDYGLTWQDARGNLPKEVQVSFMEVKGSEVVLATDNLGVFISQDNQSTWKNISGTLPNPKINALFIQGETIYVGVYQEGIFKTEDEGLSWVSLNHNLPNLTVQSIGTFKNHLIAGTDVGVFKMVNGGFLWEETSLKAQVVSLYEYDGKLVAGTSQGTALLEDIDQDWKWIRKEGAVHYTHNIRRRIIELAINGDLFYSDNWGGDWHEIEYFPRERSYVYEMVEISTFLLMSNNYGIHRSMDNGKSWQLIYETESMGFFDFLVIGEAIYGGTRAWDEYRGR